MKYLVVNKNDRSLTPFVIWLPKRPAVVYIEGARLSLKNQHFRKTVIPQRLIDLEERLFDEMRQAEAADKNKNRYSKQGLILKIWDYLKSHSVDYKKEIEFIKAEQYKLMFGAWVMIEGEPIYIPRWYYRYLNYWTLDADSPVEFRFRDLEYFIVHEYAWNTFDDENGKDRLAKTILGVTYPKHRRDGATSKSLCILYAMAMEGKRNSLLGIQSYNDNNAAKQYLNKMMPSFDNMPFYCKPLWSGTDMPQGKLRMYHQSAKKSMLTNITYANTAGSGFYDGDKLLGILTDETGKTKTVDVLERHEVVRKCVTLGNESEIVGFMMYPTTVADTVSGGGDQFQNLCDMSHFHDRNRTTGQTMSGLINYFKASCYGMEGFIDIFGKDVVEDPKEEDKWRLKKAKRDSKGKLIGSRRYNMSKREELLKNDKITTYNNEVRLAPMEYAECFGGTGNDLGFDTVGVKKRVNTLNIMEKDKQFVTKRGYFVWVFKDGSEYNSREFVKNDFHKVKNKTDEAYVKWIDDPEGRFTVSLLPKKNNQRNKDEGDYWTSNNPYEYTHSGDPFTFLDSSEINDVNRKDKSGSSQGGLACLRERDLRVDPIGKDIDNLETFHFVYDYLFRPTSTEEFGEDAIMAMVYYGGMIFPEVNVKNLWKYIVERGFKGYLLYMTDENGRYINYPGFSTQKASKQELFNKIKSYTYKHIRKENHKNILNEIIAIKNLKDMTNRDLFTAAAGCLYGSSSRHREYLNDEEEEVADESWFDFQQF